MQNTLIPADIIGRLKNPGQIEKWFINYLLKAKLTIDNSKTLARVTYYDKKLVTGQTQVTFFDGQSTFPNNSNVQNAVKPQTEHALIWGVRIFTGANAVIEQTDWTVGLGALADLKNARLTVRSNKVTMLSDIPLNEALPGLTNRDASFIPFEEPIIWAGQQTLDFNIDIPVAVGVASTNVMVSLVGIGYI